MTLSVRFERDSIFRFLREFSQPDRLTVSGLFEVGILRVGPPGRDRTLRNCGSSFLHRDRVERAHYGSSSLPPAGRRYSHSSSRLRNQGARPGAGLSFWRQHAHDPVLGNGR